jgi:hypothetical protein
LLADLYRSFIGKVFMNAENELYIYQSEDGEIIVDVQLKQETL